MDRSAFVTISGKVFVSDQEISDKILELHPDTPRGEDGSFDHFEDQEKEAFEACAKDKILDSISSDEPYVFNEVEVDMKTFH